RRGNYDQHAGFTNLESSKTVDDCNITNRKCSVGFVREFLHLLEGHGFVCFVVEVERSASAAIVSNNSFKGGDSTVWRTPDCSDYFGGFDLIVNDTDMVTRIPDSRTIAPADGWNKG